MHLNDHDSNPAYVNLMGITCIPLTLFRLKSSGMQEEKVREDWNVFNHKEITIVHTYLFSTHSIGCDRIFKLKILNYLKLKAFLIYYIYLYRALKNNVDKVVIDYADTFSKVTRKGCEAAAQIVNSEPRKFLY